MKNLFLIIIIYSYFSTIVFSKENELMIYAPASLRDALEEITSLYDNNIDIKTIYMGTAQLAIQIKNGARPDVFISANEDWMNYLEKKKLILKKYRTNYVYNSLVLIANKKSKYIKKINNTDDLKNLLKQADTKISLAMTKSTPAGIYARKYLENINIWNSIYGRYVESPNVRAAMLFVSRGDLEYGIVYKTDAIVEKKVKIIYILEKQYYDQIIYPLVVLNDEVETLKFYNYLKKKKNLSIMSKWGFEVKYD